MPKGIYPHSPELNMQAARRMIEANQAKQKSVAERFWLKVLKLGNGCWQWEGSTHGKGYPQIRVNGHNVSALRVSYEMAKGPMPPGTEPDHLCRNHACVNPDHLELVTRHENIMRGIGPQLTKARARLKRAGRIA